MKKRRKLSSTKIKTSPLLQLSSPNLYICSTVALGTMLRETKLLLHLPSLITKTHPKSKVVL